MIASQAAMERPVGAAVSTGSGFSDKVTRIRDEIIRAAALPLANAVTTPRGAYVDEEYFRFEAKTILEAGWLCVGHISQMKTPGSFVAIDLLDEPIVLVRGSDDVIRALSRVCVHRAMDIMPEGERYPRTGRTPLLMCPYHHWTYELDGRLKGCPEMHRAENFRRADWRLAEFRCEVWEGFIFVNLNGDASPLTEQYADFAKLIAPWRTAEMEIVIALEWECAFNWKVMIENWMESYHHLGTHNATLNTVMPAQGTWAEPEHPYFIRCHLPYGEAPRTELRQAEASGAAIPGFRPIPGLTFEQRAEWGLYLGYPCFMFLTTRDRVIWYRLQPISAGRCKLLTTTLVSRESLAAPDFAETLVRETKMLSDFHREDMEVNAAVQRGLKSEKAVRGRLSHLEEPVWLIQRFLAARARGTCPGTPDAVS
jgi:phenylpropionate dioxygenase-like ring-hydroxylating dioxygenase large terminal subunit